MTATTRGKTKERILDAAEAQIMANGFTATSIENVIQAVGITKGAFFYHFKSKAILARALIDRYKAADDATLAEFLTKSNKMSSDPVQRLLIFMSLCLEMAEEMNDPVPGCLFGSFCYESSQFGDDVLQVLEDAVTKWRHELAELIRAAVAAQEPTRAIDPESLADTVTVVFEGAFIVSRSVKDPRIFAQQLTHLRNYFELLFGK